MELTGAIEHLDKQLTLAMNSLGGPLIDWFWIFMSNRLVWIPLYLFLIYLLFKHFGTKKGSIMLIGAVLMILATDQFCNLVKDSVARFRPCHDQWMVDNGLRILERKGSMYGFFSGHSANSFALASFFGFTMKKNASMPKLGCVLYCWALLVAISRVFVGKHFLGDIIVGAIAGMFLGLLFAYLSDKLKAKV